MTLSTLAALVPAHRTARALSIVLGGTTLALVVGVPRGDDSVCTVIEGSTTVDRSERILLAPEALPTLASYHRFVRATKGLRMQNRLSALVFGDREDPRARLAALFGGDIPSSGQPPAPALAWAVDQLSTPEGREATTRLDVIRFLRRAERRLTLGPAVFLTKHAMRALRGGATEPSPHAPDTVRPQRLPR